MEETASCDKLHPVDDKISPSAKFCRARLMNPSRQLVGSLKDFFFQKQSSSSVELTGKSSFCNIIVSNYVLCHSSRTRFDLWECLCFQSFFCSSFPGFLSLRFSSDNLVDDDLQNHSKNSFLASSNSPKNWIPFRPLKLVLCLKCQAYPKYSSSKSY